MAHDLLNEQPLVPVKDVPKLSIIGPRRNGGRMHSRTAFRWASRGLNGVILETVVQGGQRFTTLPAIRRFFAALKDAKASSKRPADTKPTVRTGKVESAVADTELDRLGL